MIAEKQLAIVRAALRFFEEEMGPHGNSFETYLDEEDRRLGITNVDLAATCETFASLILRQVLLDTETGRLVSTQHFSNQDAAEAPTPANQIKYVALLLPIEFG